MKNIDRRSNYWGGIPFIFFFCGDRFWAGALLFLALIVKYRGIDATPLGGDESFSLYVAQLEIPQIISFLSTGDNPPLWEIILHFWIKIAGISEKNIRLLPWLFNAATVLPIYFIGAKLLKSKVIGVSASLLFILSNFSLFIAHDARVYSLVGLCSASSMYFFGLILAEPDKKRNYFFLGIFNILIFYGHYIAIWTLFLQFIIFILLPSLRSIQRRYYFAQLLFLLLGFLPFIPVLYHRFLDSGVHGTWIPKVKSPEAYYNLLWSFANQPAGAICIIVITSLALLKGIARKEWRLCRAPQTLVHLWFWPTTIVSFLISFKVSFFTDKYLYFSAPGLYLSLSYSLSYLLKGYGKKVYLLGVLGVLSIWGITHFGGQSEKNYRYNTFHREFRNLFELVKNNAKNTPILICPNWYDKLLVYYLDKRLFTQYFEQYREASAFQKPLAKRNIFFTNCCPQNLPALKAKPFIYIDLGCGDKFLGVPYKPVPMESILKDKARLLKIEEVDGVKVYYYSAFYNTFALRPIVIL